MTWPHSFTLFAHQGHDHAADDGEAAHAASDLASQFGDPISLIILAVGVLAALAVIGFILMKLRGGKPQHAATVQPLRVDIDKLNTAPPPASGAQLEVYNVPMRLALLVMAPVGREGEIPASDELPLVVDAIIPNLMQVLKDHQPEFRRWPPQLSSAGFSQIFFNNAPLPGDGGKNTRWCSLAGRFDTPSGPFLAGLACIAEKPNAIGQIAISQPGQWLDIVRVKT